jgi:hypothetical protein
MATITLSGFTTPFVPNSGIPAFDTDNVPEQAFDLTAPAAAEDILTSADPADWSRPSAIQTAPDVVRILAVTQTDTELQVQVDCPVLIDPGTETHLPGRHWFFGSPSVANTAQTGTISRVISRLLNRLSKTNRGVN